MRLPLLLMFLCGYLIYRMLVVTKLTDTLVATSFRRCRGSFYRLLLWIIGLSALLSFFIPNAVTVLTMLPVLKRIREEMPPAVCGDLTTPLTLAVIYGANIGGMGSLVGSPANLLLIGQLDLFQVPGREAISFFNWFLWSLPLVTALTAAAWLLVCLSVPRGVSIPEPPEFCVPATAVHSRRYAMGWFGAFLAFWMLEAALKGMIPGARIWEPPACLLFTGVFCWALMRRPVHPDGAPLIRPAALLANIPKRGLVLLTVLGILIIGTRYFNIDRRVARFFFTAFGDGFSPETVVPILISAVIFLTEIFSNTVVSTAFFPIAYFAAQTYGLPPMVLMIAVSAASTCAFMTPVATPCNALAFGEMKGTSPLRMLLLGAVLNGVSVLVMSFWLRWAVPLVYTVA